MLLSLWFNFWCGFEIESGAGQFFVLLGSTGMLSFDMVSKLRRSGKDRILEFYVMHKKNSDCEQTFQRRGREMRTFQKSVLKETEVGCFFFMSFLYIPVEFGYYWCCTAFANGCIQRCSVNESLVE